MQTVLVLLMALLVIAAPSNKKGVEEDDARRDLNILLGLPDESTDEKLESVTDETLSRRYKLAVTLYQQGIKAKESRDFNTAITRFVEALRQLPASSLAHTQLLQSLVALRKAVSDNSALSMAVKCQTEFQVGLSLYNKGNFPEALAHWRKQIAENPLCTEPLAMVKEVSGKIDSISEIYHQQGLYFAQKGNVAEALALWKAGLAVAPENRLLADQIANTEKQLKAYAEQVVIEADRLLKEKKGNEAVQVLNGALAGDPSSALLKARLQAILKDESENIASILKEIKKLQDNGKISEAFDKAKAASVLYNSNNDISAVVRLLGEAIEKEERRLFHDNSFKLANQAIEQGRFAEALDLLRLIYGEDPVYPGLQQKIKVAETGVAGVETRKRVASAFNKGLEQFNAGLYENALKEWKEALSDDPANEMLKGYIINAEKFASSAALERKKRNEKESEVLKLNKEAQRALLQKNPEEAVILYEKALDISPASQSLSKSLQAARREVVLKADKATGVKEKNGEELFVKGINLYKEGKYREAVALWKQVTELKPDHKKALSYIQNVTLKLQKIESM